MTRLECFLITTLVCAISVSACVQPIQRIPDESSLLDKKADCEQYLQGQHGKLIADILGRDASTTETVEVAIESWFGESHVNYAIYPSPDFSNLPAQYSISWSSGGRDYVAVIDMGVFATISYGIGGGSAYPSLAEVQDCLGDPGFVLRWRFGPIIHGAYSPSTYLFYADKGILVKGLAMVEPLFNQYPEMPLPSDLPLNDILFAQKSDPLDMFMFSVFRDMGYEATAEQRQWFVDNLEPWNGTLDAPYVEDAFPFN